jgi:hypothetical protein
MFYTEWYAIGIGGKLHTWWFVVCRDEIVKVFEDGTYAIEPKTWLYSKHYRSESAMQADLDRVEAGLDLLVTDC